jgi:hypothetical protein
LFVFLSLEVLLLLLLLQILENVYQPFWFEGGMACSHLKGESSRVKNWVLSSVEKTYIPDDIVIRVLYGGCFVEEAVWMLLSALCTCGERSRVS